MDPAGLVIPRRLALLAAVTLASCGGGANDHAGTTAQQTSAPEDAATVPLDTPGSRLSIAGPSWLNRVPHTLRYEDRERGMTVILSDATVEPGTEAPLAEAYFARVRREVEGDVRIRPISLRGADGAELTATGDEVRLRVMTVWHDGRIVRLLVHHRPEDARLAEHIIESVRFDPDTAIEPLAALDVTVEVPEGLTLLDASNEQLLLRTAEATPFPSITAAIDVLYVPFPNGEPPEDAEERGRLLGSRFAGLQIEAPELTAIEGAALEGIQIVTRTIADGAELLLYGAYLEGAEGAWLVRASVEASEADTWRPRFEAFVRSLRP